MLTKVYKKDLEAVITAQKQFNKQILEYIPTIIDYGTHQNGRYFYLFCEEITGKELLIENHPPEKQRQIAMDLGQFLGLLHNQQIHPSGCGKLTTKSLQPKYPTQVDFFEERIHDYKNKLEPQRFENKPLTQLKKFIDKTTLLHDTSPHIIHVEDFTTTNAVFNTETLKLNGFIDWDWIIGCTQSFALVNVWYRLSRYEEINLEQKRTIWDTIWNGYTQTRSTPGKQPDFSEPHIKTYVAFNILDELSEYDKWNRGKTKTEKQAQEEELYKLLNWLTNQ